MPMSFFALGEYNLIKLNQHDPGFTAMSSGVRVPSEFAIFNRLEIILDNVFAETHAALHFKATQLQAFAVDAAIRVNASSMMRR